MSVSDIYRGILSGQTGAVSPVGGERNLPESKVSGKDFRELLQKETSRVNLSQHAETRIQSREIPWGPEIEKRISSGMDSLEAKGSREALILADNLAVIANVKSRTVVTAIDRSQLKERIFTNIDSAVLV